MAVVSVPKEIGIATLHYGFNEGAILQAKALSELLTHRLPEWPAHVVDHRYRAKVEVYSERQNPRTEALQEAMDHWLPLSQPRTESEDLRPLFRRLNDRCAAIVVGSDVVWDLHYQRRFRRLVRGGVFAYQADPFYPAFPNLYWPDRQVKVAKFSYAASVGSLDWRAVPLLHRRRMSHILHDFRLISVRDERSWQFVERLDPRLAQRTEILPDPALAWNLVDAGRDEPLRQRLLRAGVDFTRPRVGLIARDTPQVMETVSRLRARGFQIVGITTQNSCSDIPLFEMSLHPLDWARIFHFMDVCLVERMHASIYCLLNQTPFVALDTLATPGRTDTKLFSLLSRFGLQSRCFSSRDVSADELTNAVSAASTDPWDWPGIDRVVGDLRRKAEDFVDRMRDSLEPPSSTDSVVGTARPLAASGAPPVRGQGNPTNGQSALPSENPAATRDYRNEPNRQSAQPKPAPGSKRELQSIIAAVVPGFVREKLRRRQRDRQLRANYAYDAARFQEYGSPFRSFKHESERMAYIQMLAHSLEKSMALPDCKAGFGVEKARDLVRQVETFLKRNEAIANGELANVVTCLESYVDFQRRFGQPQPDLEQGTTDIKERLRQGGCLEPAPGGVFRVTRHEIWEAARHDLSDFFATRHSIRQFEARPVDLELIERAVRMAQKTPSVCNRQSGRVYVFDNDQLGSAVLECQSGNRGFGHQADKILIVTSDLHAFLSIGERNQCWIDGGMFAMSLIYALHSLGLGTCCLNWSVELEADRRLRETARIAPSENVMMLIAVGHIPEELNVPCSHRKDLSEVLRVRCAGSGASEPVDPRL